jgi:TonB-linked SusC/RagA family outer membrane protein
MINKNIIAAVLILMLGSAFIANAQTEIAMTGSVKDEYGNPIPGVVLSTNDKDIYITDKDGNFAVLADASSKVTFSLMGYKQVTVPVSQELNVVLEDDAHNLAEKVNLGNSSQYREVVSDAVSTVSGNTLGKSLMARLQGTLSGTLSGLTTREDSFEPTGESLTMWIRGYHTHHGGNPAIVIDGILYDSYSHDLLYRITPEEVESVSVLKDAASQAIYGLRGGNGVIVVTTKRGTPGKLKVGVNVSETLEQPSFVIHAFDSWKYATLRNQAAYNDGLGENYYYTDYQIQKMKDGDDPLYPNTNWADMIMKDVSQMQRVALDATGGNKVVKYYTNINFLRQGSFWNTDEQEINGESWNADNQKIRLNFRSNIDININSWISAWMNLAGSFIRNHYPSGGNSSTYNLMTYMPSTVYGATTPEILDSDGNEVVPGGEVIVTENLSDSPYARLNRGGYANETDTNIYGQAGIRLNLDFVTPGLWVGGSVGYLSYITSTKWTTRSYARYVRDDDWSTLNFTQYGTTQNGTLGYSKSTALYGYQSYKGEAGWARDFGRHHLKTDAYGIYMEFDDNTGNISATYDFRRVYTGAEVFYDFDKRYALKFAAGYSGSEYFPRKNRFLFTPSISGAWVASNESFINDAAPWLSLLKIRGSYGITGNDDTGYDRYSYEDQVSYSTGGTIGYLGYNVSEDVYGNSDLEPEKIKKWDVGIDLGLANQFQVTFDYYNERINNGLGKSTARIPVYQGISLGSYPVTNLAKFKNWGWELSVSYSKRFNPDWKFFFTGHLDYNRNKVIYIGESAYDDTYAYSYHTEGYPLGQSWGYLVDYSNGNGLFNFQDEIDAAPEYSFGTPRLGDIKYKDLNEDGVIDEKDLAPIGNGTLPKYSYGFTIGFDYKNFEVSMLFQGLADYWRDYGGVYSSQTVGDGIYTASSLNAWTAEKWLNDEKIDWPALSTNTTTSMQTTDYFFKRADFIRLKNIEISYKFPKKVCDFLGAGELRVYLGGQNLFTIDGMDHNDTPVEGSAFAMPIYRMYRVGFNVSF